MFAFTLRPQRIATVKLLYECI